MDSSTTNAPTSIELRRHSDLLGAVEHIYTPWRTVLTDVLMVCPDSVLCENCMLLLTAAKSDRMEFSTSKEVTVAPTFEDMHLKESLLRGVYAYGYESPSAVQSRAIVQVCKGRDTIAQAQSGTGKTATFAISILQVIDTVVRESQGMPTADLFGISFRDG